MELDEEQGCITVMGYHSVNIMTDMAKLPRLTWPEQMELDEEQVCTIMRGYHSLNIMTDKAKATEGG